jgi:hypothetical protein
MSLKVIVGNGQITDYESGGQRFESFRARQFLHDNNGLEDQPRCLS